MIISITCSKTTLLLGTREKMIKTISGMPKEVQDRFKVLHMLSDKRSKLNDEFNEACKKLEAKILEKKRPFSDQRR